MRQVHQQLPAETVVYFADQAHVPYGPRPMPEIQSFSRAITAFLLGQSAKLVVVACNTASAAALTYLRGKFLDVPFVGMEPAVKPAAETTKTGKVGVLATPATFQGALYASVVERFGAGVELFQHTCPGLVAQIEKGEFESATTRAILEEALHPMLEKNIDTVVLGCTHYPYVIPLIKKIVGEHVRVIDPAPAIVRQVGRMLDARGLRSALKSKGKLQLFTSGDTDALKSVLPKLLSEGADVTSVVWRGDHEVGKQG